MKVVLGLSVCGRHGKYTLYLRLDDAAIIESEEVQPGAILDYDSNGRVIGIELLSLSLRTTPEKLRMLQFETVG